MPQDHHIRIIDPVRIPTALVDEHEQNPNAMTEAALADLDADIQTQGFDEPISVVPKELGAYEELGLEKYVEAGKRFVTPNGNHRLRVMRGNAAPEILAVLRPEWTEEEVAIQLVRRNVVHGELDGERLSALVDKHFRGMDTDILARQLGFPDAHKLEEHLADRNSGPGGDEDGEKKGGGGGGGDPAQSLATMMAEIMGRFGGTVDQNYIAFIWMQQTHLLFAMDDRTRALAGRVAAHLEESGEDANELIARIFEQALEGMTTAAPES